NLLFDFLQLLLEKDYLEAYDHWIFMKGNQDESDKWFENNEDKFNEFADWFLENPLRVNKKNYFSRFNYQ
ncbi:MAG: hypothetical protein AAFU64_04545, partial [Bacteroidota bacterium]